MEALPEAHQSATMTPDKTIAGFSRLNKTEKIAWLTSRFFPHQAAAAADFQALAHPDAAVQRTMDGFSENTVANYALPYGVAPNFIINGRAYAVPMVTEESSVVAAASSAAKFWMSRGGFQARVLSTRKLGQVHFFWRGNTAALQALFPSLKAFLLLETAYLTANMEKRGGGVIDLELRDMTALEPHYYQLMVTFETCDSMGANFINSVLEAFASALPRFLRQSEHLTGAAREVEVVMAILSNYTPDCLVRAEVSCPIEALAGACQEMPPLAFAEKFAKAVRIAALDPHRATTHNKGIFNGVDAVILATANDFRAVEACGHTYAARDGQYRSLSHCTLEGGVFRFWLDLPLAIGTVGGLTNLHPLARRSLEMLGQPTAPELMMVVAATGLAQNFAALRSLVTTGIQKGHMRMHLLNILSHLGASEAEEQAGVAFFADKVVSYSAVREFVDSFRQPAV